MSEQGQSDVEAREGSLGDIVLSGLYVVLQLLEPLLYLAAGIAILVAHWKLSVTIGGCLLMVVLLFAWIWRRLDDWTDRASA